MQPYRISGLVCPRCQASLRAFQRRLICDECSGMLIEEADLTTACAELDGRDVALSPTDGARTKHTCPKCNRTMMSCRVVVAPSKVRLAVLHCDRDGFWIEQDALTTMFARIVKRRPVQSAASLKSSIGFEGRMQGLCMAGPKPAKLKIRDWHNRPRRTVATPIDAYRDQPLACPRCGDGELTFFGDRYACSRCAGTFVQNAAFEAMVGDMAGVPWRMPPPNSALGQRACPVCGKTMLIEEIEQLALDRCAAHGLWFDPHVLARVLERASGHFDARGLRAWLLRRARGCP